MNNWNNWADLSNFNPLKIMGMAQKTWGSMEKQVLSSQCRLMQAYLKDNSLSKRLDHDIKREQLTIAGRNSELLYSRGLSTQKHILYLHGGGFALGSLDTHRELVSYLARTSKTKILSIDYRLAPDFPYPAGLEDALAAWDYLLKFAPPNKIAIAGDSAGGGLALALVQKIIQQRAQKPAALYLMSPWLDLTSSSASYDYNAATDAIIFKQQTQKFAELYAGKLALSDPRVSPLFGDLQNMIPTFIQVSQQEVLLEDSRYLAQTLDENGIECELEEVAWQPHVWQLMCGYWPQSELALRRGGKFLHAKLSD